jgi:protein involved in sex pheromone biosynthesis
MIFRDGRRILAALLLSMLLLVSACTPQAPSRYDRAQQESTQQRSGQAVAKDAKQGGSFNKFFPNARAGYSRVYTQEKKGFAEAKLKKGGQEVAVMSISDIKNLPIAAAKFKQSTEKLSGYPSVNQGANMTAVLVADRYQVKVQSRDPSFTQSDREAWLKKFNLNGLARLAGVT